MSILSSILDGIATSALEVITEDVVTKLQKLSTPDAYEEREEMAEDLNEVLGYDPETYWNRRIIGDAIDAQEASDGDAEERSKRIDLALDRFNSMRNAFLEFAAIQMTDPAETADDAMWIDPPLPAGKPIQPDDPIFGVFATRNDDFPDDDDSDEDEDESLVEEANSDVDDDDDEDPDVLSDDDED